jgi:putative ABC transport system substrate-binding protein
MAVEILNGKTPAEIPAINMEATDTVINQTTATAIGVTVPESISATIVE